MFFMSFELKCVPEEISGKVLYKMKTCGSNWVRATRDRRHFMMNTEKLYGKRKIGKCEGHDVCSNKDFLKDQCQPKKTHLRYVFKRKCHVGQENWWFLIK